MTHPSEIQATTATRLRVLFICHSRAVGGAELYLEQLARRMGDTADVRVVCRPDAMMDEWAHRVASYGTEITRLALSGPAGLLRLRQAIRWASVVHLTLANRVGSYQILSALACRLEGRPLACTHQLARETEDLPVGAIARRFRALALGAIYGHASRHVAVSAEGRALLPRRAGLAAHRVVQINNGVDLDRYICPTDEARRFLRRRLLGGEAVGVVLCCTVARLSVQKGLDVLVRAAAVLRCRADPPVRFLIIGDGELKKQLAQQIAQLGLEDTVRLVGSRPPDEIPSWLAAADVFVLPSRYEGMSFALMEAMASGLPAVATRVSGTLELIPDDEYGRVVPVDDVDALARAIEQLVADPDLRHRIASRGCQRVRAFSWDACFSQTAALLREIAIAG